MAQWRRKNFRNTLLLKTIFKNQWIWKAFKNDSNNNFGYMARKKYIKLLCQQAYEKIYAINFTLFQQAAK